MHTCLNFVECTLGHTCSTCDMYLHRLNDSAFLPCASMRLCTGYHDGATAKCIYDPPMLQRVMHRTPTAFPVVAKAPVSSKGTIDDPYADTYKKLRARINQTFSEVWG